MLNNNHLETYHLDKFFKSFENNLISPTVLMFYFFIISIPFLYPFSWKSIFFLISTTFFFIRIRFVFKISLFFHKEKLSINYQLMKKLKIKHLFHFDLFSLYFSLYKKFPEEKNLNYYFFKIKPSDIPLFMIQDLRSKFLVKIPFLIFFDDWIYFTKFKYTSISDFEYLIFRDIETLDFYFVYKKLSDATPDIEENFAQHLFYLFCEDLQKSHIDDNYLNQSITYFSNRNIIIDNIYKNKQKQRAKHLNTHLNSSVAKHPVRIRKKI